MMKDKYDIDRDELIKQSQPVDQNLKNSEINGSP